MPVRVVLAGHNLDSDLLAEIRQVLEAVESADTPEAWAQARAQARQLLGAGNWTPETLSAAYARVSRDPQSLIELRARARAEVQKARQSNQSIVFGLGHSSVAEHAVFNFDILGLSRLAVEVLQRQRLSSYTEKSQRYILLAEDWVLPEEVRGGELEPAFREVVAAQQSLYRLAYDRLLPQVLARHPDLAAEKKNRRMLEGLAKEDARYALGLGTTVQLGATINARNLESLIARCRAHPLHELRELGEGLYNATAGLAPSLIKYTEPSAYRRHARRDLEQAVETLRGRLSSSDAVQTAFDPRAAASVKVVLPSSDTGDPDGALVSALLFAGGAGSAEVCRQWAAQMTPADRRMLVLSHLRELGPHDSVLREYEFADIAFELVVSASCFAQLKRHRMATLTPQPYDPALGLTIPESFFEAGLETPLRELAEQSARCFARIAVFSPAAAPYVLINAHRRRVLFKLNAREFHHLARLRQDAHAQWDIRAVVSRMSELARERMPLSLLLAAGKDRFEEERRGVFPAE